MQTIAYGVSKDQVADLYLPTTARIQAPAPVICLIHGGFWRMPWGRDYVVPVAEDLAAHGFVVWSLEYRRVGAPGGGWPGTFEDVGRAVDHLATLVAEGLALDLRRVASVGHSAGGHLALWCAQHLTQQGNGYAPQRVTLAAAVGLAPVADLAYAAQLNSGNGAVVDFLGASPTDQPQRYRSSSPIEMLPLRARQLLIHGTADTDVPIEISRRYAAAALTAGDDLKFIELPGVGHMDLVDVEGTPYALMRDWLSKVVLAPNA